MDRRGGWWRERPAEEFTAFSHAHHGVHRMRREQDVGTSSRKCRRAVLVMRSWMQRIWSSAHGAAPHQERVEVPVRRSCGRSDEIFTA